MIGSSSNGATPEELQLGRTGQVQSPQSAVRPSSPATLDLQHVTSTKNSLFTSTVGGKGSLALAGTFPLPAGRAVPSR